jgi:hypothetical protein
MRGWYTRSEGHAADVAAENEHAAVLHRADEEDGCAERNAVAGIITAISFTFGPVKISLMARAAATPSSSNCVHLERELRARELLVDVELEQAQHLLGGELRR